MLELTVKKHWRDFQLDLSLQTSCRRLGILGQSGSGKSMTLHAAAGVMTPDEGRIRIGEQTVYDSQRRINLPPQQRSVGILFQNYALFPKMTVAQNILLPIKGSRREKKLRLAQLLKDYHLEGLEDHYPHQLSGGQKQRAAMARMMGTEPGCILLDEPFSALDGPLRNELADLLRESLEGYHGQLVMVSHSLEEVYRFSDEIAVIHQGSLVVCKERGQLLAEPEYLEAARLTGCENLFPARPIDDHHLKILPWNKVLTTGWKVDGSVTWVGIPGERLDFSTDCVENRLQVQISSQEELPGQWKLRLSPKNCGREGDLVLRTPEKPKQGEVTLVIPPEYVLPLKEGRGIK